MSALAIRPARPDEAELLQALELSAARSFIGSPHAYAAEHPAHPVAVYAALADQGLVLMAEAEDGPVGFAACAAFPDALHLKELGVAYERQGRGAGRRLVQAVAGLARSRGLAAVTLTTFADLPWNAPWYRRLGFEELRAGGLGERLRQELEDEYGRGLSARCAMRLDLSAP